MIDDLRPTQQQIKIVVDRDPAIFVHVSAEIFGTVAVHKSLDGEYWVLTITATGLSMMGDEKKARVEHLARLIGDIVPEGGEFGDTQFVQKNKDELWARQVSAIVTKWAIGN